MAEICVSSHHTSIAQMLEDAEFRGLANRPGFLIELRLDSYADLSVANFDGALKVFGQMFIMTQGGPADSTLSMVLYLYNIAFRYGKFRFGYASALAWFLAVFIFFVALISFRLSRERE
jgi:hypothetical protein